MNKLFRLISIGMLGLTLSSCAIEGQAQVIHSECYPGVGIGIQNGATLAVTGVTSTTVTVSHTGVSNIVFINNDGTYLATKKEVDTLVQLEADFQTPAVGEWGVYDNRGVIQTVEEQLNMDIVLDTVLEQPPTAIYNDTVEGCRDQLGYFWVRSAERE